MQKWARHFPGMRYGKVYIFPTGMGFVFLVGTALVIITGATYNNNLVFLLGFFLFSIFIISMVETHNNLRGIDVESALIPDQFAGLPLSIPLRFVNNGNSVRQMVEFYPSHSKNYFGHRSLIEELGGLAVVLHPLVCDAGIRGVWPVPQVVLTTVFPLGLFRAWTVLNPGGEVILYPSPIGSLPLSYAVKENDTSNVNRNLGHQRGDDFREHRRYVLGDSSRRVDWKVFARRDRLMVKEFEGTTDKKISVRFSEVLARDLELVLSQLSRWLELAKETNAPFELVMPGGRIPFGVGPQHYQKCQRELARFNGAT